VAADYRESFGREAPPPQSLVLMTDSDDTCGSARALYADFRFLASGGSARAAPGLLRGVPRP